MPLTLSEIITVFEKKIPLSLQEPWDRSGLQVGSRKLKVRKVLFAYDTCKEVLREAIQKKADLIVTHHPLGLKDYQNIDLDTYEGELIRLAVKNDIAIYTAHTNHDSSEESLNRYYAAKLKLNDIKPLKPLAKSPYTKLVVFIPLEQTQQVLHAIFEAGGGGIGPYSCCSFRTLGVGTFKGDQTTSPFLGKPGELEEASENRVEVLVTQEKLDRVVKAMLKAHPYEEVAYDLFPMANIPANVGSGIYGTLSKPLSLKSLLPSLKKLFGNAPFRLAESKQKKIKFLGICTGSGASLLNRAISLKLDLFITGDVKYHNAVEALRHNLTLMDVGHFHSEIASVSLLKNLFQKIFENKLTLLEYKGLKEPMVSL